MSNAQRLILVRHGLTANNVAGTIPMADDPEPLTDLGVEQMQKAGQALRQYLPLHLYCSTIARARQSADIVAAALGVPVEAITGIEERNWGELGGTSWEALQERLNAMTTDERYVYMPPGGESWQQFEERINAAIANLVERHPNETLAVVTHGGVMRCLVPYLFNVPREERLKYNFDNASITVLESAGGNFHPVLVNSTAHLGSASKPV